MKPPTAAEIAFRARREGIARELLPRILTTRSVLRRSLDSWEWEFPSRSDAIDAAVNTADALMARLDRDLGAASAETPCAGDGSFEPACPACGIAAEDAREMYLTLRGPAMAQALLNAEAAEEARRAGRAK